MSCTVFAIPYVLAWAVGSIVAVAVEASQNNETKEITSHPVENNISETICNDVHIISEATLLEKSLETPFMDKNILMKTLEEHGVSNITEEFGVIKGEVDTYKLTFEKTEEDKPYFVTISYLESDNLEEKMNDLNSEYALNVQEDAYLNIIEKLKENNMQIEEEEVFDDNTIVLTVNLEG